MGTTEGAGTGQGRGKQGVRVRRFSVRARVAAAFGMVFVLLGGVLLAGVYLLARWATENSTEGIVGKAGSRAEPLDPTATTGTPGGLVREEAPTPAASAPGAEDQYTAMLLRDVGYSVQAAAFRQQLSWSLSALGAMAVAAVGVGWWVAGRALRPVHTMTSTARRISDRNLHERIALSGPRDELADLADTFDAMLERIDAAFDSQRRFVANASHELRTPLAVQRAAIQIGLNAADARSVERAKSRLLEANRRSEQLIDGLLMLARSDLGPDSFTDVDVAAVVAEEVAGAAEEARGAGVTIHHTPGAARVSGDRLLIGQMIGNLVRNAIRHNYPGGHAEVEVRGGALTVRNTGAHIHAERVPLLFEPFQRGADAAGARRSTSEPVQGAGLGLPIIRSIARAHGWAVEAHANEHGGLTLRVEFSSTGAAGSGERAQSGRR